MEPKETKLSQETDILNDKDIDSVDSGQNMKFLTTIKEIMPDEKRDVFELTSKDEEYIAKYKKYQLRETEYDTPSFVLIPRHRKEIADLLPQVSENLYNRLVVTDEIVQKWPQSTIISILSKGLILESVKYSQYIGESIAKLLKENPSENSETLKICDCCVGTGITSSHIWFEMKKNFPEKKFQIHAIDNSIESLTASMLLLETQKIPYTVLKDTRDLLEVSEDFEGVVLIASDVIEFLEKYKPENLLYDASVSENGISYFTSEKHEKSINLMAKSTRKNGVIAVSSLNPSLTVNLDKKFLFREILQGDKKYQEYTKKVKDGVKQYEVEDGEIKKAITKETGGQIELLNNLLRTDFPTFLSYMKGLSSATKAAKVLVSEIKSPVEETKKYIEVNYPDWELVGEDWNIKGAPCNVLIVKV